MIKSLPARNFYTFISISFLDWVKRVFCLFLLLFAVVQQASAQFTITENFKGSVSSNIIVGGPGGAQGTAYLTSGNVDPVNAGWLRLTNSTTSQRGYAYINKSFPSTLGVLIDFEYKMWRNSANTNSSYNGGDGIGIFLFDANATFSLGGYGGSLGYAPNTTAGIPDGLAGGYVGIGLDAFGNYGNNNEGRIGRYDPKDANNSNEVPNAVILRGPTTTNKTTAVVGGIQPTNRFLAGAKLGDRSGTTGDIRLRNELDYNTAPFNETRPTDAQFYRRVQIEIKPTGTGLYNIIIRWTKTPNGAFTQLISYTTEDVPPANMKLGFAASSGGAINYHEIRNLLVTTPGNVRVVKQSNKDFLRSVTGTGGQNQITYNIDVINDTDAPLSNIDFSDVLSDGNGALITPAMFTINSISNSGFAAGTVLPSTSATNQFTGKLNLAANTTGKITVTGTLSGIPAGNTLTNTTKINPTDIQDQDLDNNTSVVNTPVFAENVDLIINKSVNNSCLDKTNGNTFTLNVANVGSLDATYALAGANKIVVTKSLPTTYTFTQALTDYTGWTRTSSTSGGIITYTFTANGPGTLTSGTVMPSPITYKVTVPASVNSYVDAAAVQYQNSSSADIEVIANRGNNTSSNTLNTVASAPAVSSPVVYCQGANATALVATPDAGNTLIWYRSIGGIGSANPPVPVTTTAASTTYYVSQTNGSCESPLSSIVVNVLPALTSGTVAADQTFCVSGNPAVFTQTTAPTGGSGTYTYQWQKSVTSNSAGFANIALNGTSATYDEPASITQTTYYRRLVTSTGGGCGPVISNVITVTVNPVLTAGTVSGDQTFCVNGDPAVFTETAAATGANGTYTYQWQSSTDNITFNNIGGATNVTYDAPAVTVTTYYRRVVSSAGSTCGSQNSNVIKVTVQPVLANNTVTSPANTIFCVTGDPGVINGSVPAGGDGTNYTYQWQSSTDNVTFTDVAGATGATYDPPVITQTTYYLRKVSSGSCTVPLNSNTVTFTVNPLLTAGTIGASQTFCVNGDPTLFTQLTAPAGGSGTYTYQWQISTDNTNFTDISGATSATYDAPAITQTTYYRRAVSSVGVGCGPAFSPAVTVTVNPAITGNSLSAPAVTAFCESGNAAVITGSIPLGGNGTYTYAWEQSINNGTTWTAVAGASGKDFDPPAVTVTTQYRRIVSSGTCSSTSNVTTITISNTPSTAAAGPDINHCAVDLFTMAANTPVVGTGTWALVSGSATINNPGSPASTVNVPQGQSAILSWTISNGACAPSVDFVTLTNYATPTTANAGPDVTQNNSGVFAMQGNTPGTGTGTWTVKPGSGPAVIANPANPNTTVTIPANSSAILVWTITNGPCAASVDEVTINYVSASDIKVVKSVITPGPFVAGQNITYQILVTNAGPSNATGLVIADAVPPEIMVSAISAGTAGTASIIQNTSSGNTVNVIANIASGAGNTVTITATGKVRADYAGTLNNTATVTSPNQPDPDGATSTVTSPVTRKPQLTVVKNGPANVIAGQAINYKITVSNTSGSDAIGTVITDAIPAQVSNVSWVATKTGTASFVGGGTGTGSNISLTGSIPAGGGNTIIIDVTGTVLPSATGSFDNIAKAAAAEPGVPEVNSNTVTTNVSSVTGLAMLKNGPSSGEAGKPISYILKITNNGLSDARNAIINDLVPPEIKNVSWSATVTGAAVINGASNGSGNSINLNANIPTGAAHAVNVTINGVISAGFSGESTNTATASPSEAGSLPSSSTVKTNVTRTPVVAITKTAPATLTAGQSITYTIEATNTSFADAKALVIKDNIPVQISNVNWVASAAGQAAISGVTNGTGNTISITGDLPTGANNKITITVTGTVSPSFSGALENTASATPAEPGTTPQTAIATTQVARKPVLVIQKSAPATINAGQQITYTIDITNTSTSDAIDAGVQDLLPAGISNVTWSASATGTAAVTSGINGAGNTLSLIGNIPAGAGNKISIVVTGTVDPSFNGVLNNTATATPAEAGTTPVHSTATTNVSRIPVIQLSKSGPVSLIAGQQISYTIEATNSSTSDAKTLAIADNVPAQISNVTWTTNVAGAATVNAPLSGTGNAIGITGDLPAGAQNKITITVSGTVNPSFNGSLTNSVTATPAEPGATPKTATSTATVSKTPVLTIQKSGPASISAGEQISYTLTIRNAGTANADDATIQDLVPANISNVSWISSVTGSAFVTTAASGTGNNVSLKANVPAGAGNLVTVTITGTVLTSATGTLSNAATITPAESGTTPNTSTVTTTIKNTPVVSLVKTGPASISAGQVVTYTLTATNNGPSDAKTLAISDAVPVILTNVTWSATKTGTAVVLTGAMGTGNTVSVTGDLPAGAANSIVITITGTVPSSAASGTFSNTAVATPAEPGIAPVNSNTVVTTLDQQVGVLVQKSAPTTLFAGENITYTLAVTNNGPSNAKGLVITDAIPAGIINSSWSTAVQGGATVLSGSTGTGNAVNLSVDLPAGTTSKVMVTITGKVNPKFAGTQLVNTAIATPSEAGNPPVNSNTTTTQISKRADIQINKSGPATAVAGSAVTYTIQVSNSGPSDAENVNIIDNIPAGILNATWTASVQDGATLPGASSGTGNINMFAGLPAGAGILTIVVNGTLSPDYTSATLVNTATATPEAGITDPTPATSTVTTQTSRVANVRIVKSGPANIAAGETISYTLRIVNDGPSNAPGVVIADIIPSQILTPVWTATGTNGATVSAPSGSGNVNLTGSIPSGTGVIEVTVTGTVNPATLNLVNFTNTATANFPVGSPVTDPETSSNTSSVSTIVNNDPVLRVSKSGPSTINIGDPITYKIVVANGGSGNITNAQITDNVPADVEVISWTAVAQNGATLNNSLNGTVNGTSSAISLMGDIPAGDPSTLITITINGRVSTSAHPTFTNTVSVVANGVRESSVVTAVNTSTDIVVEKTGPQTILAGEPINYTVKVSNAGPVSTIGLTINDIIPAAVQNVSWTAKAFGAASVAALSGNTNTIQTTADITAGAGNYILFNVTGTINPSAPSGNIVNTASVTMPAGETDFNAANNSSSVTTAVVSKSGFSVIKSGPSQALSGTGITYTIKVANAGPSNAVQTVIKDNVPAGINNVSWIATKTGLANITSGGTGSGSAINVVADFPAGAGNEVTIVVNGTIDAGFTGNLVNSASAEPAEPGNPPVGSGNVTTTVTNKSGISIVKSGPSSTDAGKTLTYLLEVTNSGPGNAVNAAISDVVPVSLTDVTWVATAASGAVIKSGASGASNNVAVVADLPAGPGKVLVTITAHVPANAASGNITNTAKVTPAEPGNPEVPSDPIVTTVVQNSGLTFSKNGPASVNAGEIITYVLNIGNSGPSNATAASLSDLVPSDIKNVSWTTALSGGAVINTGATGTGNNVTLSANVPVGGSIVVTVTGTVDPLFTGSLVNSATLTPSEPGKTPLNSAVTTTVAKLTALKITKSGASAAVAGQQLTYQINVSNTGPSTATAAVITDLIPVALKNVTWNTSVSGAVQVTNGATGSGNNLSITAAIPAGLPNALIVNVQGTIDPAFTGTLSNVAKVLPGEPGGVEVTTPPVETIVTQHPVITVSKTGPSTAVAGSVISYVIEVNNTGLSNAANLAIIDDVPDKITNVSWQATVSGTSSIVGASSGTGNGVSLVGNIPAGSDNKIRITVTGTIDPSFAGTLTNIVKATPSEPGNPPVTSPPVQTQVDQRPVIVITKTGPATATAGTTINYMIEVTNTGLSNANNLAISDVVPAALTNVSWTTNTEGTGVVISGATGTGNNVNLVGRIPKGAANKIQIFITGKINASFGGTINNIATATPSEAGNPPVVTPPVVTQVELHPAIAITKTGPEKAIAGSEITYTIEVTNGCLSNAKDLLITDNVSTHLSNVSWTTSVTGSAVVKSGATGTGNTINITADISSCPGNKIIITIKGTINPGFAGIINNTATAAPSEPGNPPVITPPVQTIVDQKSQVVLTKTGPAAAVAGSEISYVIEATNTGLSNAANLIISDDVPVQLSNVSWTAVSSGAGSINSGSAGSGNIILMDVNLPAGAGNKVTITVKGTINPSFAGKLSNIAKATPSEPGNPPVVTPPAETDVSLKPVIVLNKTGPATAVAGSEISYVIEASNTGLSNASNLVISDVVPATLSNVSWTASVSGSSVINSGANGNGNTITLNGNIPAGAGNKISIVVKGTINPSFAGKLSNIATATPSEPGNPPVATPPAETDVTKKPVIGITKTAPSTAVAGAEMTYLIEVVNTGLSNATGLVITDAIPSQLGNVSWTTGITGVAAVTAGATGTGNALSVTGNIPAGTGNRITITIKGTVAPSFVGKLSNIATVTPSEPGNPPVVTPPAETEVGSVPGVVIRKTGPATAVAGTEISYLIEAGNTGLSNAVGLTISDAVPATLSNVSWSSSTTGSAVVSSGAAGTGNIISLKGNIPAGAGNTILITVRGTISAAFNGNLANTATATPAEPGTTPVSSTSTAVISRIPVLSIQKTGPSAISAGQAITYNLIVSNTGTSNAGNASISDIVPVAVNNVSWTAVAEGSSAILTGASGSGNNIIIAGNIPAGPGNVIRVTVKGTVNAATTGDIENTATATPSEAGTVPSASKVTTTVSANPSVSLVKSGPSVVSAGQQVTYTVTAINNGPSNANNLTISDAVPAGLTGVNWTAVAEGGAAVTAGTSGTGNNVTVKGNIAAGAGNRIVITISGNVPSSSLPATLSNTAVATPSEPGIPPVNSNTITTTIDNKVNIRAVKSAPSSVSAGEQLTYTLQVFNDGPTDAKNLDISDALPAGLNAVSWTTSVTGAAAVVANGSGSGSAVNLKVNIPAGAANSITVTVNGTVDAGFSGNILTNQFTATPIEPGNPAVTSNTVTTTVNRTADIQVQKTGPQTVVAGQAISYTINVSNTGPSNADVVNISDVLPSGLSGVSWTAVGTNGAVISGASSGTGNVTLTAGIPVGNARVQIIVNATVDANFTGTSLVNTATAVPGAGVTDPSPASSTVTTAVGRIANVRIIKSGPANISAGGTITYGLRIVNDGPSNAPGVIILDAISPKILNPVWTATVQNGATITGASNGTGNVSVVGNIPANTGVINVTITGQVDPAVIDGDIFINTATANFPAGSPVADPDQSSNSSSVTTQVNNDPVLKVSKSGPATVNIGDPITYTIEIRNGGAGNITNAQISDPVPADVAVSSWTAVALNGASIGGILNGTVSGTTNSIIATGDIPATDPASVIRITIQGIVTTSAHPTFTNTVTVTANGVRESSVVTAVNQSTDIQVQKSGPQTVAAGSAISYSIKVSNSGPIDVVGLLIRDNVPAAIEGLSWTAVASGSASITAGASGNTNNIQTTANIPVGAANYITINVSGVVKANTAAGSISNTADVQLPAGVTDFNTSNNSSTVKTDITKLIGLSVSKSGPQNGVSGSAITYTIRVVNNGPSNAVQTLITDAVPSGIKNVSWTAVSSGTAAITAGSGGTGNAVAVRADIPSGSGNAIDITVRGTIDASFVGQLVNTAVVTPSEAGNPPVNSGMVTTTVVNESNISIVKSGPGSVDAGRTVTYTLDVSNAGPGNAVNAAITDQVPAILTNVSWTATASSGAVISSGASGTGNAVNVKANLSAGQGSVRVQITGLVPANTALTSFSNTAVVTPSEAGNPPVTSNEITTSIVKNSALSILKNGPGTISSGEAITYTIAISNVGPSEAVGAKLSDIVPAEVKNVSWTSVVTGGSVISSGASGTGNTVALTATVPVNGTVLVTITGKVDAVYSGALINKATVTPAEAGKLPLSSQVTSIVRNVSALRITKTGAAEATAGQQMKYVIKVANDGPGTAQNAVITDAVPQALTNVSWTASAGGAVQISSGSTGTGNALSVTATIPAGTGNELIIDITGTINPAFSGKLTNTAKATPAEPGNLPITTPPVETNVKRNPGVSVIKTGPAQLKSGERITYVIEVGNTSLSNAENLAITDMISKEITNVEWSAVLSGAAKINAGGTGSGNNVNVMVDLPAGAGNKIIITVTGLVSKSFTGRITNVATATPSEAGAPVVQSNVVETIIDYADFIIPNVITPNGDGANDVFKIKGIENYPGTEIFIVNRWGNEVYRSNDYKNDWGGSQLNEGTYYYVVKRREKTGGFTTFKGWVFIKR